MPDIVLHTRFGAEVLRKVNFKVKRDIYRFGLLGPDPFLFYRFYVPPFRNKVNKYSSVMHREHTADFLVELARRSKNNRKMFSYLCGFLCHYALDSTTHPYINAKAKNSRVMHMAIEHRLDIMSGGNILIPPFLPSSMKKDVGGAITKIYGWPDAWEKLRQGRLDMGPFYKIVSDKNGILARFAPIISKKLALVSYKSKAIEKMNLFGFYPLYSKALKVAVNYLNAAYAFVKGSISEAKFRKIIGNHSYIDG